MEEVLKGLLIIQKYDPKSGFGVGHDQIWCGNSDLEYSEEDKKVLDELAWFVDEECESWSKFI